MKKVLGLKNSISQILEFFSEWVFFNFLSMESFFKKNSASWNIRKAYLRKYKNFFKLRAGKLDFPKSKEFLNLGAR